jgi:hypothetical protein
MAALGGDDGGQQRGSTVEGVREKNYSYRAEKIIKLKLDPYEMLN